MVFNNVMYAYIEHMLAKTDKRNFYNRYMNEKRKIKEQEHRLISFLLKQLDLTTEEYPIGEYVVEYEGGVMGSISFCLNDSPDYDQDLIQVEYTDADNVPVVITLTKDKNNSLLDLDFWKSDFSKLIQYPKPNDLVLKIV